MAIPNPVKRYTVQEYYDLERAAAYRSEFFEGEIFAMAGGTSRHSLIVMNIGGELRMRLKGKPCTAYESNMRLKIKRTGLRAYPDVSVYCGPLERDEEDRTGETFVNPAILVEVLSPSTEAYDRGSKAANYRYIESLKTYILVSQDNPHVEIFERQADGSWRLTDFRGLDAALPLPAIGIELPLAEIYDKVDFSETDAAD